MVLLAPPDDRSCWCGFGAIAPDYRGYGLSDPPPEREKATFSDIVCDLLGMLDALDLAKVFLVGKEFELGIYSPLYTPRWSRVSSLLELHTLPPGRSQFHKYFPKGLYISRFQEPGRAETDFGRLDAKTVVRNMYILLSRSEATIAEKNQEIMDLVDPSNPSSPLAHRRRSSSIWSICI